MRSAVLLLVAIAACTPDVASGSYLCGPNADCPPDQACNGADNICVIKSAATEFSCKPDKVTEPDDTSAQAYLIPSLGCVSVPFINANCMIQFDSEDWTRFVAPSGCAAVQVEARITFPVAFERLGMELWNLDSMTKVADDTTCPASGQSGEEIRCLDMVLTGDVNYGIKVHPLGDGSDCAGKCAYNRYTLRVQLATP